MPAANTAQTAKPRPRVVPLDTPRPDTFSNEGVSTLREAGESANHIAAEYAAMCSDSLAATLQSGTQVANMLNEISRTYADACACTASTLAEIARESVTCRSPNDVVALQKKSMDGMNAIVEATFRVHGGLFAAWSKAMEPVVARLSDAPERIFRAVAD